MEQTKETKEFYAFISYKREDERWARWLQHRLEHYRLPANLNGRTDLPKEIRPIFRDTSELLPGNLPQQINDALAASHHLIVICSPHSAQSVWVNKEIETFIAMGKQANIIPFIVDGHPFAQKPDEECFPVAISNLPSEQELLGANVAEMGREAAAVKTVARMFGIRFDTLWGRYQREQKRRRNWIIAAVAAAFLFLLGIGVYIWMQNDTLKKSVSRAAAKEAMQLIEQGDGYTAQRVALAALDKAYTPEAEAALRQASLIQTTVLRGHSDLIYSIEFSPNGKHLLTFSGDSTIRIWNIDNGACILTIKEKPYSGRNGNCTKYSPNGKCIVSTSDSSIHIWNASTGECIQTINGHQQLFRPVFSPDSKYIATALSDSSLCLWEISTGKCIKTFETHLGTDRFMKGLNVIAFSPDGKRIVMTSCDDVFLWNVATGECILTLKGGMFNAVEFTRDGKHIITSSFMRTIHIWDATSGECLRVIHGGHIAALGPDGNSLATLESGGKSIDLWNASTGAHLLSKNINVNISPCIAFCPDNNHVAVGLTDFSIYLWKLSDNKKSRTLSLEVSNETIHDIAFNSNDSMIVSISSNSQIPSDNYNIRVWDASTGKCCRVLNQVLNNHANELYSVKFSPDNKHIVSAADSTVRIWNVLSGECLHTFQTKGYYAAAFSPDGRYMATPYQDTSIYIWDVVTGNTTQTLSGHKGMIFSGVVFSPDGKWLASGEFGPTTRIWDLKTGNVVKVLDNSFPHAFSADGKWLVSCSKSNTICVWDVSTWRVVQTLKGHTWDIENVSFSPNCKYIISIASDKTVRIWDIATGSCLLLYNLENALYNSVSFCSDGKSFHFGELGEMFFDEYGNEIGYSPTITFYEFPTLEELIQKTRAQFKDNPLTPEERRQYYLE